MGETAHFSSNSCTFPVSESTSLRIRADTAPRNPQGIVDLQKGLILLHNGVEVVGEGTGFGVPIAKYSDETVFSGSSRLSFLQRGSVVEVQKEFFMDLIARDGFRNARFDNRSIRNLLGLVSAEYQRHRRFAGLVLLVKGLLLKLGFKSSFHRGPSKGTVMVTYTLEGSRVSVKVNLNSLSRVNLAKVFVLNEQAAHFFRTYTDSEGRALTAGEIGAWEEVSAKSAQIASDHGVGFHVRNMKGAVLRRGTEFLKGSLDWIGLDYELQADRDRFEYEIEVQG